MLPDRFYQINWLENCTEACRPICHKNDSREEDCVTRALNRVNWQALQHRRRMARLGPLHKAVHNRAAITIPPHVQHKSSSATRNFHPLKFIPVQTACDAATTLYCFTMRWDDHYFEFPRWSLTRASTVFPHLKVSLPLPLPSVLCIRLLDLQKSHEGHFVACVVRYYHWPSYVVTPGRGVIASSHLVFTQAHLPRP